MSGAGRESERVSMLTHADATVCVCLHAHILAWKWIQWGQQVRQCAVRAAVMGSDG